MCIYIYIYECMCISDRCVYVYYMKIYIYTQIISMEK